MIKVRLPDEQRHQTAFKPAKKWNEEAFLTVYRLLPLMCFCLVASEGTAAAQGLVGAKDICSRGYEIPKVIGRNDAERWENLAKIGPKLIGMTKTQLEAAIGVGDFNPKKGELAYALTEVNSSREGYAATIAIMSLKNGKVVRFCVYSTNWSKL